MELYLEPMVLQTMLTPILHLEKKLQVYDKTRLDAQKSFAVKGAPKQVPEYSSDGFPIL
jgi:hypothetical protein